MSCVDELEILSSLSAKTNKLFCFSIKCDNQQENLIERQCNKDRGRKHRCVGRRRAGHQVPTQEQSFRSICSSRFLFVSMFDVVQQIS